MKYSMMKSISVVLSLGLMGSLGAGCLESEVDEQLSSGDSDVTLQYKERPTASLRLDPEQQKALLGGEELAFFTPADGVYRYEIIGSGRVIADVSIASTTSPGTVTRDTIQCRIGGALTTVWYEDNGRSGAKGTTAAIALCKTVAVDLGRIVQAVPSYDWDYAPTVPPVSEAGVTCKVATVGDHAGKCMCKCDHGWNPTGALFCAGFYLAGAALTDCYVGVGCEAPLSSCAN